MKTTKLFLIASLYIFGFLSIVKAQVCFTPATNFWSGDSTSSELTSADFNSDGIIDLIVVNTHNNSGVALLLGNGSGSFGAPAYFTVFGAATAVLSEDFNEDGKADLAITNTFLGLNTHYVSILIGDGLGGFATPVNYSVGQSPAAIISADFNGDGNIDLATSNGVGGVSTLLGDGTGVFNTINNVNTVVNPFTSYSQVGIVSADFNADGNADLASSIDNVDSVTILLGNGMGGFIAPTYLQITSPCKISYSDFNGDNKIDLAVSSSINFSVSISLGNGTGGFGVATYFYMPTFTGNPSGVVCSDFNYDGDIDVALSISGSFEVIIMLGDGTGSLGTPTQFPLTDYPEAIIKNDFNGDGKTDIATANYNGSVSILLNCDSTATTSIINHNNIEMAVSLFPNPNEGIFQIKSNTKELTDSYQYEIYNINGEKINFTVSYQGEEEYLNLTNAPKGIYFMKTTIGKTQSQNKIIVQ